MKNKMWNLGIGLMETNSGVLLEIGYKLKKKVKMRAAHHGVLRIKRIKWKQSYVIKTQYFTFSDIQYHVKYNPA
jgi:hypothetical protein